MSTIEDAIYTRTTGYSGLTSLVALRVYPTGVVPENTSLPYVTYEATGGEEYVDHAGGSGLHHDMYQFNIFATTRTSLRAVWDAFRDAWQGYVGTVSSVDIQSVFLGRPFDIPTTIRSGQEQSILGRRVQFRAMWRQATPVLGA